MKYTPRNEWVLVQLDLLDDKTNATSGILLRKSEVEERKEATVLAVGPGRLAMDGTRIPIGLDSGDRVIIHNFSGQQVGGKDERLFLVREESIYCKAS